MLTGLPPFQSQSEYLIFQKIQKLEYSFHEGFDENAMNLIKRLLVRDKRKLFQNEFTVTRLNSLQVIEPTDRIGARDARPYSSIRNHAFFEGVDFESLYLATPPSIQEFIPESSRRPDPCWSRLKNQEAGADRLNRLMLEDGGAHSDDDAGGPGTGQFVQHR